MNHNTRTAIFGVLQAFNILPLDSTVHDRPNQADSPDRATAIIDELISNGGTNEGLEVSHQGNSIRAVYSYSLPGAKGGQWQYQADFFLAEMALPFCKFNFTVAGISEKNNPLPLWQVKVTVTVSGQNHVQSVKVGELELLGNTRDYASSVSMALAALADWLTSQAELVHFDTTSIWLKDRVELVGNSQESNSLNSGALYLPIAHVTTSS